MCSPTRSTRPKRLILAPGILVAFFVADAARADCAADLNGDCVVNAADLLEFLACDDRDCRGDLNGDGVIDGADLGLLLAHWGVCLEDLEPIFVDVEVAVREITDVVTRAQELREFDVFIRFENGDDKLLNVFYANIACDCPNGFVHAPIVGGALPLLEVLWDALDLTYDSFVSLGPQFADGNSVTLEPNFPTSDFVEGDLLGPQAGWFNGSPGKDQGARRSLRQQRGAHRDLHHRTRHNHQRRVPGDIPRRRRPAVRGSR